MRTKDPSVRTLEIPNDVLAAHGLFPAPVAFELAVPDESVLAEMMAEDGLAFADCGQCSHNECGVCGRYGGETDDYDENCSLCANEGLIQAADADDPGKILDDPDKLMASAGKHFPSLKDVDACFFVRYPAYA